MAKRISTLGVARTAKHALAVVALGLAVFDVSRGDWHRALLLGFLAGMLAWSGRFFGSANSYASIRNRVLEHLHKGNHEAAAAVLAVVPPGSTAGHLGRDLFLMKAEVALHCRRLTLAASAAEEALATKPRLLESLAAPDPCSEKEAEILALAALVAALDGQAALSRTFAARPSVALAVSLSTQARVELAACVALWKQGDSESVATRAREHQWLFEYLPPKERYLLERLQLACSNVEHAYRSADAYVSTADRRRDQW